MTLYEKWIIDIELLEKYAKRKNAEVTMGLLNDLFENDNEERRDHGVLSYMNEQQDNNEYTDEELDEYGLDELQKEEVKKGNEDIFNFEEEDLEDNDYYSDDE